MDTLSPERRSWNMSRIRGKNTQPELRVRSLLRRMGFRLQLYASDLPGKPDIVLVRRRTAIFVHGCFWHRHSHCPYAYTPKSRKAFWLAKFKENVRRDRARTVALRKLDWKVGIVWECETEDADTLRRRLRRILARP